MRSILAALMLCLFAMSSNAEAHRYHHYRHVVHVVAPKAWSFTDLFGVTIDQHTDQRRTRSTIHPVAHKFQDRLPQEQSFGFPPIPPPVQLGSNDTSRPSDCYGIAWCGCWLRNHLGLADKSLNLAANWAHVGRATEAHVGAIVVWSHHVGLITGQASNGGWIVTSGNDGNRVRTRVLSVSRAIAFREGA